MTYEEAIALKNQRDSEFKAYCEQHQITDYWDHKEYEKIFHDAGVYTDNHVNYQDLRGFSVIKLSSQLYFVPASIMCCGDTDFLKQMPVTQEMLESDNWELHSYVNVWSP